MVEGFGPLVRVRRRQDAGVAEIRRLYLGLLPDTRATTPADLIRAGLRNPAGFAVYAAVSLAVRSGRESEAWVRGR